MEKGEGPVVAGAYEVHSYPTYLFLNSKGEVIHRSTSNVEADVFIAVGKTALNPERNLAALKERYNKGEQDYPFLMDYYVALQKVDPAAAGRIGWNLSSNFPEAELNSALGWKVIKYLAKSETDRLGNYFMTQPEKFVAWASQQERDSITDMLIGRTLYGLITNGDEKTFFSKLQHFKNSDQPRRQKQAVMIEAAYYQQHNQPEAYVKLTTAAMQGVLKNDADKLSFLARAAGRQGNGSAELLHQAYLMAKQAVLLRPEEYSTQGTLAMICLSMHNKEEGVIAAKKAYSLAETSKIQKNAEKLLADIEQLPSN
jgi:PHD/YefM family antitoxin component YafN of YafNO toxin-antitoxin module